MRKILFCLIVLLSLSTYGQDSYKTDSGIEFKVGDTLKLGSPLSHLGWTAIFKEKGRKTLITNKNFINKEVVIKSINTKDLPVSFSFLIFRKEFYVNIDDALANKEIIPTIKMELSKKQFYGKYELLKKLKDLLDNGTITKEEFKSEKKKILKSDE